MTLTLTADIIATVGTTAERQSIINKCLYMNSSNINQGTSGNISLRVSGPTLDIMPPAAEGAPARWMLVTPSALPYGEMRPSDIVAMPLLDPTSADAEGAAGFDMSLLNRKPSTEWRIHRDMLLARPEVNAVVHTHSTYATALAMCRRSIPACHYMVAAFGGNNVRCCGYATYGTQALSDMALEALEGRTACLMANHGALALGPCLEKAMWRAAELETIAKQYHLTLTLGGPVLLSDGEIAEVLDGFSKYGLQSKRVVSQ